MREDQTFKGSLENQRQKAHGLCLPASTSKYSMKDSTLPPNDLPLYTCVVSSSLFFKGLVEEKLGKATQTVGQTGIGQDFSSLQEAASYHKSLRWSPCPGSQSLATLVLLYCRRLSCAFLELRGFRDNQDVLTASKASCGSNCGAHFFIFSGSQHHLQR